MTRRAIFHGLFGYSPRIVPVTPFIAHWNTRAPKVYESSHTGREDVLERLRRIIGIHDEIAERVAGNLLRAERLQFFIHRLPRPPCGGGEIDLVALDDPARDETGVVGFQVLRRKGLDPAQQLGMHAHRRADEVVVEKVLHPARGRLPADMPHLPRLHTASLLVRFRRVVVVAGLGSPPRVDLRVESPIRQVDAPHRVGQRFILERRRRKPQVSIPRANAIARRGLG